MSEHPLERCALGSPPDIPARTGSFDKGDRARRDRLREKVRWGIRPGPGRLLLVGVVAVAASSTEAKRTRAALASCKSPSCQTRSSRNASAAAALDRDVQVTKAETFAPSLKCYQFRNAQNGISTAARPRVEVLRRLRRAR